MMAQMHEPKTCQLCDQPAADGYRYCKECCKYMRLEMRKAGYLQYQPSRKPRAPGSKEDTYETKYGMDR